MKYFHISLGFKLKDRPKWLIDFRKKYDKPYPYHITLKNETEIKESDIGLLKQLIEKISKKYSSEELEMIFDSVIINETSKGHCIMVAAKNNVSMINLQTEIIREAGFFGKVFSQEHATFEKYFVPHITIGRHLSDRHLLQAEKDLPDKVIFEIEPERLVVSIVNRPVIEERLKDENQKYFYFRS